MIGSSTPSLRKKPDVVIASLADCKDIQDRLADLSLKMVLSALSHRFS